MTLNEIKEVIEYELVSSMKSLKRTDSWMYICSFFALVFALKAMMVPLVISLLLLIMLQGKRDYEAGNVRAYQREKYKTMGEIERVSDNIKGVEND